MLAPSAAPPAIRVVVNDRPLQVAPVEERGRVLVPMRAIFEALGARVDYDRRSKSIGAATETHQVTLAIASKEASVDGLPIALDVPPRVIADRTYVPLRFVGTALGAHVAYDARERLVDVSIAGAVVDNESRQPTVTYVEGPTPQPPNPNVYYGVPLYQNQSDLQLSVSGRWFAPGAPINVELTAPPGGQAYAFMCTSDWRYQMYGSPQSPYYYATLYAPRDQRIDSCPITAMYVAWNGNVTYSSYPVFIRIAGPATPAPTAQPTPQPTAPPATAAPRTTQPVFRKTEPQPTPIATIRPQVKTTPRPAPVPRRTPPSSAR